PVITLTPWVFQSIPFGCSLILPALASRSRLIWSREAAFPAAPLAGLVPAIHVLIRPGTGHEAVSRDRYAAVDRQNLAGNHARFVARQIKRHPGDVLRLDQP